MHTDAAPCAAGEKLVDRVQRGRDQYLNPMLDVRAWVDKLNPDEEAVDADLRCGLPRHAALSLHAGVSGDMLKTLLHTDWRCARTSGSRGRPSSSPASFS